MRFLSIIFFCFVSLSLGAMTLKLESDGYILEALLKSTLPNFSEGTIDAPHAKMGDCKGVFSYDARTEIFMVEFDPLNRCDKENIEVDITKLNLRALTQGQRTQVNFRSELFYMRDMKGFVRVVAS